MGGGGKLEREAYWRDVLREQKASGLWISAFCRDKGISEGSFYNWRASWRSSRTSSHRSRLASSFRWSFQR